MYDMLHEKGSGVQGTNDDASHAKAFAVSRGYWKDPIISQFVKLSSDKHMPEISRGYFARSQAIKKYCISFLKHFGPSNCQIVNLGAGFDTLYWQLQDTNIIPRVFLDIDYPDVIERKARRIQFRKLLPTDEREKMEGLYRFNNNYALLAKDLTNLSETEVLIFQSIRMEPGRPTIVIGEFVFGYMAPRDVSNVISFFSDKFAQLTFIVYDPIQLDDVFGQKFVENAEAMGAPLHGYNDCLTVLSHSGRFLAHSFQSVTVFDMLSVYNMFSKHELQRVEAIEFLDEKHILEQMLLHYCIVVAHRYPRDETLLSLPTLPNVLSN